MAGPARCGTGHSPRSIGAFSRSTRVFLDEGIPGCRPAVDLPHPCNGAQVPIGLHMPDAVESAICRSTYLMRLVDLLREPRCGPTLRLDGRGCGASDQRNQSTLPDRPQGLRRSAGHRVGERVNTAVLESGRGSNARGCSRKVPERRAGAQMPRSTMSIFRRPGAVQRVDGLLIDDGIDLDASTPSARRVRRPPAADALDQSRNARCAAPPADGGSSTSARSRTAG